MTDKKLRFYDMETLPNYFLIVGLDEDSDDEYIVLEHPSFMQIINFINEGRLVGFNNHRFDDVVLSSLMNKVQAEGYPFDDPIPDEWAYNIGQELINKEDNVYYAGLASPTEDVMKMRNFQTNQLNLKGFENMMGMEIIELDYPFDQPLPDAQAFKNTLKYCKNDVLATKRAYNWLESDAGFHNVTAVKTFRLFASERLGVNPDELCKKSVNSLMINMFQNPSYDRQNFFDYIERCNFEYAFKNEKVKEWYEKAINWADDKLKINKPETTFIENGVEWVFGLGGGHGHNEQLIWDDLIDSDVQSLYPTMLINLLGLGEDTALFKEIVELRIGSKKTNPALASGLKLGVNSVYGLIRSLTSGAQLYNKYLGLDICILGQLLLYDYACRLHEVGADLVNVNTDGVIYKTNGNEFMIELVNDDLCKRCSVSLEHDALEHYFARDVNNYFVWNEDFSKIAKQKGVFGRKPYSTNYASSLYVMEVARYNRVGGDYPSMLDLFNEDPSAFTIRAKNKSGFDFTMGIVSEYDRFGKRGQLLKKKGEEFAPVVTLGRQFRGVASVSGLNTRNHNLKTMKYIHNGRLKTGKIDTLFRLDETTPDDMNFEYYQLIGKELAESMTIAA